MLYGGSGDEDEGDWFVFVAVGEEESGVIERAEVLLPLLERFICCESKLEEGLVRLRSFDGLWLDERELPLLTGGVDVLIFFCSSCTAVALRSERGFSKRC